SSSRCVGSCTYPLIASAASATTGWYQPVVELNVSPPSLSAARPHWSQRSMRDAASSGSASRTTTDRRATGTPSRSTGRPTARTRPAPLTHYAQATAASRTGRSLVGPPSNLPGSNHVFTGAGTTINVAAVLAGSAVGALLGHRLPPRTRTVVTDGLGLVTLLIAALSAMAVLRDPLTDAVGDDAPVLIVLGAVLLGGITGSVLRIEDRIEGFGGWLQRRLTGNRNQDRARFVEGFVTASLIFCVGPLTVLGAINEGLGEGPQELVLKSVLDGFASIAFAASFGIGVMAAALSVAAVQGSLTVLAVG